MSIEHVRAKKIYEIVAERLTEMIKSGNGSARCSPSYEKPTHSSALKQETAPLIA